MTQERLNRILAGIRDFIRTEALPLEIEFIQRPFRELLPRLREKRDRVKALGLWAPPVPETLGVLGCPLPGFARVSEERGRTPLGHYLFNCQAPDVGNMEILMAHGTAEQKDNYFLPLAQGDVRSCFS